MEKGKKRKRLVFTGELVHRTKSKNARERQ